MANESNDMVGGRAGPPGWNSPPPIPKGLPPLLPQQLRSVSPISSSLPMPELVEKRMAICRACEMFRDADTKVPAPAPFCTMKCGSYLKWKWENEGNHCCQGKW